VKTLKHGLDGTEMGKAFPVTDESLGYATPCGGRTAPSPHPDPLPQGEGTAAYGCVVRAIWLGKLSPGMVERQWRMSPSPQGRGPGWETGCSRSHGFLCNGSTVQRFNALSDNTDERRQKYRSGCDGFHRGPQGGGSDEPPDQARRQRERRRDRRRPAVHHAAGLQNAVAASGGDRPLRRGRGLETDAHSAGGRGGFAAH